MLLEEYYIARMSKATSTIVFIFVLSFFSAALTEEAPQIIDFPNEIHARYYEDIIINVTFSNGAEPLLVTWKIDDKSAPEFYNMTVFKRRATSEIDEADITVHAIGFNGAPWSLEAKTTIHIYTPRWFIAGIVIGSAVIIAVVLFILVRKGVCQMPSWLGPAKSNKTQYSFSEGGQTFDFGNGASNTVGITLDDDESL